MIIITEVKKSSKSILGKKEDLDYYLEKIYNPNLKSQLVKCYQCVRCSGVCQLSKVQKYTPSRIIQRILEGFEDKVIESGVLWDCLMCNSCLQACPEQINFADIVRMAKYKMTTLAKQSPDKYIAHKGIYTTVSEIMSESSLIPERNLDWVPKDCKISDRGNILYFVGCLPYFKFEFNNLDSIPSSTLRMLYKVEKEPIVVLKNEVCCGHDLYWGQGKFEAFIKLALKNISMWEEAGISTIITTCAEGYRTFKVDYPKLFDDFNQRFEVKHIIDYVYDNWKQGKIDFISPPKQNESISITFHDPCRLSRFLPKENNILEKAREIFLNLEKIGYNFKEMKHNKEHSLCCGIGCWMNCNERSKALRYQRLLEAKEVSSLMITACPKCEIHFTCLQNDIEELASVKILDFTEFIINLIKFKDLKTNEENKN